MRLDIPVPVFHKIAEGVGSFSSRGAVEIKATADALHPNQTLVKLDILGYGPQLIKVIRNEMKEAKLQGHLLLSAYLDALDNPEEKEVASLRDFFDTFKAFLKKQKVDRQWLFSMDENVRPLAYMILHCTYQPEVKGRRNEIEVQENVSVDLAANYKHSFQDVASFTLHHRDVSGMKISQILLNANYVIETQDLLDEYDKAHDRFQKFRVMQAEQFWTRGYAYLEGGGGGRSSRSRRSWWNDYNKEDLSPTGNPTRVIQDEEAAGSEDISAERAKFMSEYFGKELPVPTHPLIYCFSLKFHKSAWIHAANLLPYKYEEELADKVIMPTSHAKLVDALTSKVFIPRKTDEGENRSRVIRNKAQSSIIICVGPPGTGKTLTAEAYCEKMKRPMYEVQAGQIGINDEGVEDNLKHILERSKRLRAPLVINEGDVYIRKRGLDMRQNAVVAVFLKTFEYHSGLIFVTTNIKLEEIDNAIISRALAVILYDYPTLEERKKIWPILSSEMGMKLDRDFCNQLAELSLDDLGKQISGRDIQNWIRLTQQYAEAQAITSITLNTFRRTSAFRAIEIKKEKKGE